MSRQVLSISQVNEYIRHMIETDSLLGSVAVRGEISNYKVYPSGHHYFTLKDDVAALKCVMFKSSAIRMKFRPENGMQIIAMGRISVYPRDGAYQLYCTAMVPDGVGDLYAAFEQMKAKLAAKGMFDPACKKTIPKYPEMIGIVTSSAGAAVHDMLRILRKRYPLAKVRLLPVRVQGSEAPGEIAAAIGYANQHKLADVLIVGRGGGPIEDLWAFNDELVAQAIFDSKIPVISAVGHEPDVTISDFVADLRAATPSNAAELAVPDQEALSQQLDSMSATIRNALLRQLKASRKQLDMLSASPALRSPYGYLNQHKKSILLLKERLVNAQSKHLSLARRQFISNAAKLDAMSPLKVLSRGYAMLTNKEEEVICSARQVNTGESLHITLKDGTVKTTVNEVRVYEQE